MGELAVRTIVEEERQAVSSLWAVDAATDRPRQPAQSFRLLKAGLAAIDLFTVSAAVAVAVVMASSMASFSLAFDRAALILVGLTLPGWLGIFAYQRLYTARFVTQPIEEFRRIVRSAVFGVVMLALAAYITKVALSRQLVGLIFIWVTVFLTVERAFARTAFIRLRQRGALLRPVVLVGNNAEADAIAAMLASHPHLGYQIREVVDCSGRGTDRQSILSTVRDTLAAVDSTGARGVIIASTAVHHETSNRLIRVLTDAGLHVELSSSLVDVDSSRLVVRPLGRMPMMYVEPVQRAGWRRVAKRTLDIVIASGGLIAAAPILLVAAVGIKFETRGPLFFRQERVGRDGRTFRLLKLRTMVVDAEARLVDLRAHNEADGPLFKMRNDPRVTAVGAVLRKMSIDEIPQFWNVLRNDMSVVGPRPAIPHEMADWNPDLYGRLRVKPGITGMWQVSGRSNSSFEDYQRYDLYYVDNWSLLNDLTIIAKTVPSMIFRKGAF